jgi:putative transposase
MPSGLSLPLAFGIYTRLIGSGRHAQRFLSARSRIHNHFQLRRHHLNANQNRTARNAAFCTWRDVAEVAPAA